MTIRMRLQISVLCLLTACSAPVSSSSPPAPSALTTPSASASLSPTEPSPPAGAAPPNLRGSPVRVLVDNLQIRETPGEASPPVSALAAGQLVTVLDGPREADGYGWYQVVLNPSGQTGWIASGDGSDAWIAPVANGDILAASGRRLWTLDQDGNPSAFASLERGWVVEKPAWAPDGRSLAVGEWLPDLNLGCVLEGRITILDGSGQVIARTSPPSGTYDASPIWSPDGSQLAFTRNKHTCATLDRQGFPDLYVMPAGGGSERRVIRNADGTAWSPMGDTFAFFRFDPTQTTFPGDLRGPEIWLVNANGGPAQRLGGRVDDGQRERLSDHLTWAPDGSVIAYVRAVGADLGTNEIDVIDRGGQMRAIMQIVGSISDLNWLADGTGLVFVEGLHLRTSVIAITADGDEWFRVRARGGAPNPLALAPDGAAVAWSAQGNSVVWIQPLGSEAAERFRVASNAYQALAWQPQP